MNYNALYLNQSTNSQTSQYHHSSIQIDLLYYKNVRSILLLTSLSPACPPVLIAQYPFCFKGTLIIFFRLDNFQIHEDCLATVGNSWQQLPGHQQLLQLSRDLYLPHQLLRLRFRRSHLHWALERGSLIKRGP